MADKTLNVWPGRDYLRIPLLYLARHSLELNLKSALTEYGKTDDVEPNLNDHNLLKLWVQLVASMRRWGLALDDEWTAHCEKLLRHVHDVDPDGERFRYPMTTTGACFEVTEVDLEGLIQAYLFLELCCDCYVTMHVEGYKD